MGEERIQILQMLAEGKITPEEADKLLQAIEEGEQPARAAGTGSSRIDRMGEAADRVVSGTLNGLDAMMKGLDDTMKGMEESLARRQREFESQNLSFEIQEKIRHSTERAVAEAQRMEERAQRAARRAEERAERVAERAAERASRYVNGKKVVLGIHIDRENVTQSEHLTLPAEPGDCLEIDSNVGDVTVQFYDGDQIELDVSKTVWGTDRADAEERAAAKCVQLKRLGSTVKVEVDQARMVVLFGIVWMKDTRIDYTLRVPHGTHLRIDTKVGDLRVRAGAQVGTWDLNAKVGNIDLAVAPDAGFRYTLKATAGNVAAPTGDCASGIGGHLDGRFGDGTGSIRATTKTGDVRVHC